jgi:hypothetical protein
MTNCDDIGFHLSIQEIPTMSWVVMHEHMFSDRMTVYNITLVNIFFKINATVVADR